jgi:hypothetical protein
LRCTAISCGFLLAFAGCSGVGVDLTTKQPINVDINMKLDVYQHSDASAQKKIVTAPAELPVDVQVRRKNRMGEIQVLKNSRAIGENHLGLLEIREAAPGEYGDYTRKTVDEENKDRMLIMEDVAKKQNLPLEKVQAQHADLANKQAFNGEWIEQPQPDGAFKWARKGE